MIKIIIKSTMNYVMSVLFIFLNLIFIMSCLSLYVYSSDFILYNIIIYISVNFGEGFNHYFVFNICKQF